MRSNRSQGLERLNRLFRAGQPPTSGLDGRYAGELVAVDIAPGITQLVEWLTSFWMPWKGKHLSRARSQGNNIFDRGARRLFRTLFPLYKGVTEPETTRQPRRHARPRCARSIFAVPRLNVRRLP